MCVARKPKLQRKPYARGIAKELEDEFPVNAEEPLKNADQIYQATKRAHPAVVESPTGFLCRSRVTRDQTGTPLVT